MNSSIMSHTHHKCGTIKFNRLSGTGENEREQVVVVMVRAHTNRQIGASLKLQQHSLTNLSHTIID